MPTRCPPSKSIPQGNPEHAASWLPPSHARTPDQCSDMTLMFECFIVQMEGTNWVLYTMFRLSLGNQ